MHLMSCLFADSDAASGKEVSYINLLSDPPGSPAEPSFSRLSCAPKAGPDLIDYRRDRPVTNRVLVIGILQNGVWK